MYVHRKMKIKIISLILVIIFFGMQHVDAAEDLSHITNTGGTVYFADDFESGYQYLGSENAYPGGGYWAWLGGNYSKPEGTGCSSTTDYHNTVITNEATASNAVSGSNYALKTPYDGDCPNESYSRDTTILDLGAGDNGVDKTEVYVRWYQKWVGEWNSGSVQQKFTKFCGNAYSTINGYMTAAHFSFGPYGESWRCAVNNYNGQFDWMGGYCDDNDEIWMYQTEAASGNWGWDSYNNEIINGSDGEFTFETGRWYCLEIHVKMNSDETASDAVLEAWIDGTKVFGLTDFQYYTGNQTSFGVGYLELQHIYYDRSLSDQPTYMDNIVIADSYIGPVNTVSDVTAPSSPSGISIS